MLKASASEMTTRKLWHASAWAALVCAACTPVAGPVDVEVVALHDDGSFALETAQLDTVVDLHRGVGSLFDVRAGAGFDLIAASNSGVIDSDEITALESAESAAIHLGWDVHPQLTWDPFGQRFVADDMDTLLYLTLFENFEEIWAYYRDTIGDRSLATSRKTFLALYSDVYLSAALPLPLPIIPKNDNAAFHPLFDYFLVMRVHDQDGIPLGMHGGITAHEFQHRVHHWNVTAHETIFPAWKRAIDGREALMARAVDEGLADIFALGFIGGDPAFLASALVDQPLSIAKVVGLGLESQAALRDLDGDYARNLSWEEIQEGSSDESIRTFCGSLNTLETGADPLTGEVIAFNPYCLGTLIARTLWETADENGTELVTGVLPAVHRALPLLAARIALAIDESGEYDYRIPWALDAFAAAFDDERRARFCTIVHTRFAPLVEAGEIEACP
jgi:hypothetical protein